MTPNFIIIDDDAIDNMICKMAIARHFGPVKIDCYQNPAEALDKITDSSSPANVLFLDLNMPQMNGWDFLRQFAVLERSIREQFAVYILSGSTSEEDRQLADENPLVSGFVSKPLTAKKLEKVFKTLPESYGIKCFE